MQTMVIDAPTAQRFIAAYKDFLGSLVQPHEKAGNDVIQWLALGRDRFVADRALLDRYRAAHPKADAEMLDAIAQSQFGRWVHLKDTRAYSVLMDMDATQAYAVLGLTQPLRTIDAGEKGYVMGSGLVIQAALVPLNGRWVCDGLIQNPVWLGRGYKRSYTASYTALRKSGGFSVGPLG
jgi:hypothetical protein